MASRWHGGAGSGSSCSSSGGGGAGAGAAGGGGGGGGGVVVDGGGTAVVVGAAVVAGTVVGGRGTVVLGGAALVLGGGTVVGDDGAEVVAKIAVDGAAAWISVAATTAKTTAEAMTTRTRPLRKLRATFTIPVGRASLAPIHWAVTRIRSPPTPSRASALSGPAR